ncbi:hypothetical protein NLX62_04500 [Mycobacteriaceae bacterium Msp059]|nr:hypothetical protein [Mycobacteriaceae bacterium Msp059]
MGVRNLWKRCTTFFKTQFATQSESEALREFVYLDEVSVISLLASQVGEITSEVSDALSMAEDVELSGNATASTGVLKGQFGSKFKSTSSESTQITRKANIQSLFRDFREKIISDLKLPDELSSKSGAPTQDEFLNDTKYCVEVGTLSRGQLIEVTVELEAAPVFRVSTMLSEIYDIGVNHPEIFGSANLPREMGAMVRLFERLLTGLVPIQGKCTDLCIFEHDGLKYLARKSTLQRLSLTGDPLVIVGVTDQQFYWKDLRRILFSKSEFKMLCRIERSGIQDKWNPVKLSDVFNDVLPQMGDLSQIMSSMSSQLLSSSAVEASYDSQLANALSHFAAQLLAMTDAQPDSSKVSELERLVDDLARRGHRDIEFQRDAFDAVASLIGYELTPQRAVECRREARLASGLRLVDDSPSDVRTSVVPSPKGSLLDTEVIAIYW